MRRFILAAVAASAIFSPNHARAGDVRGVVELFTSQGCSSCPPADEVLGEVSDKGGVLTLALHVDYWDRLGWKDTFSSKAYTQRQRGYAAGFNTNTIYTPQFVINGLAEPGIGSSGGIESTISDLGSRGFGLDVPVSAKISGDKVVVTAGSGKGAANIVLVSYIKSKDVAIERGENAGRTITYRNAVTSIRTVGKWNGENLTLEVPKPDGSGIAILLQRDNAAGGPGAIIGAATGG